MTVLVHAEPFYLFMRDHKVAAAAAIGEPGWAGLGAILEPAGLGLGELVAADLQANVPVVTQAVAVEELEDAHHGAEVARHVG